MDVKERSRAAAAALTRLPGFAHDDDAWTYKRQGHQHEVHQITLGAMRHEVHDIAAPNRLRVGFWSASESDPQGWTKITAALH